jgi:hypothetical protein
MKRPAGPEGSLTSLIPRGQAVQKRPAVASRINDGNASGIGCTCARFRNKQITVIRLCDSQRDLEPGDQLTRRTLSLDR